MGVGFVAVSVLTWDYGRLPYVALILAFSFGTYGLAKKTANVGAVESLAFETAVIAPFAAAYVVWLSVTGAAEFGANGVGHALLYTTTGIVTAIPLICFGAAATRVSMVSLGLLQYLAPILQFGLGVLRLPRGHAARPLGRLRPGLARRHDLHLRGGPQPPSPPAGADRGGVGAVGRADGGPGGRAVEPRSGYQADSSGSHDAMVLHRGGCR